MSRSKTTVPSVQTQPSAVTSYPHLAPQTTSQQAPPQILSPIQQPLPPTVVSQVLTKPQVEPTRTDSFSRSVNTFFVGIN